MNIKQKILDGLGCTLDEISEERLIDILLDAYQAKERRIKALEGENAREREAMHEEREAMKREHHLMRTDPLYCAPGRYYFAVAGRRFSVDIQGSAIKMLQRDSRIDVLAQRISENEFHS